MSNIDKQAVQAVADMKAGYTLGHADVAILNELARIALASLEAEPVAYMHRSGQVVTREECCDDKTFAICCKVETPLYTTPPAPVSVPDDVMAAIQKVARIRLDLNDFDGDKRGILDCLSDAEDALIKVVNSRAAMLQGAEPVTTAYKSPDDFICMLTGRAKYLREKGEIKSPELLERAAAALQGESVNTPSIPNGWKLVPIDPTKDMLRAGQSVVGFWLNTVHCYSKMLAAAPAAPQQEVKP